MARKVIISAAITGAIHTPTMSEYLPITPKEIADQAIDAAKAGAASVHIHARDPQTGIPSADQNLFAEIVERIQAGTDAIICITTGGGTTMTIQERAASIPRFKPELASLNMGSINFSLHPLADKHSEWKHEWEPVMLAATKDNIFRNTFGDLETILGMMEEAGTKPELEIYDAGHLQNAAFLMMQGLLKPPVYLQFVLGILGGMAATIDNLVFLKNSADRLLGPGNYQFSGFGAGRMEFPICTTNVLMGGHCRVGLEDNLNIAQGEKATSNAALVEKMVRILGEFGLEPATPAEARKILGTKGSIG